MSNIFQPLARVNGGLLPINVGAGPLGTAVKNQHLNLDSTGNVYCVSGGTISHYGAGLPFDADGRLVLDDAGSVAFGYHDQGIPFGANGGVWASLALAATDYIDQSLAFGANGAIQTV